VKIMKISEVKEVPRSGGIFTGTVGAKTFVGPVSKDLSVSIVSFPKGIRNTMHSHTSDQCLWVLSGKGTLANEKEQFTLTEGVVAYIPAGERHWHGATDDSPMSHISILRPGQTKG
jgi:quercetin dioxygenase-like cupin family protein